MGGGGGSLSFITEPLKKEKFNFGDNVLTVKILQPDTKLGINLYRASIERLAVALGGSNNEYENLKTKHTEPEHFFRGPM